MAVEKLVKVDKPAFNINMSRPQIEAKIETVVGKILTSDFKQLVWRGFLPADYQDIKFIYKDWLQEEAPAIPIFMRAGRSDVDADNNPSPAMWKWEEELIKIFQPIFEVLSSMKKDYDTKNK